MPESVRHVTHKHTGKITFWYFVPKAGIAFILFSIIIIAVWNIYKDSLQNSFLWIISAELVLFSICFIFTNIECKAKKTS